MDRVASKEHIGHEARGFESCAVLLFFGGFKCCRLGHEVEPFTLRTLFWLAIALGTQDDRFFPLRITVWLAIGLGTQDDRFFPLRTTFWLAIGYLHWIDILVSDRYTG